MTTVLLIPGLTCDDHVWTATRDKLTAAGHQVAIGDVRTQDTITKMAQSLLEDHEGDLVVIGHSMGGRVAMEMARLAPARITALGLLNTGMHPLQDGELPKREANIALANTQGMEALATQWIPGMMAQGLPADPEVVQGLRDMVMRMTPDIHERQLRALIARPDAALSIGAYEGPMLLMTGRQDQFSPISQHEDIRSLCPQAELHIIENAGHFAPVEQPASVAAILTDWVTGLHHIRRQEAS